jgi:hypothetical protein
MTRPFEPLQFDRPLFVKIPFDGRGKTWARGEYFPWLEMGIERQRIEALYSVDYLHHNSELEDAQSEVLVGDGLEKLDVEGLQSIVKDLNSKVKAKTSSMQEYERKKCKQSQIKDKQIALIRSWRRNFGHLE